MVHEVYSHLKTILLKIELQKLAQFDKSKIYNSNLFFCNVSAIW